MYYQQNITSIIDNCNLQEAFNKIIKYYDPNKSKNIKTKILDLSSFFSWNENDYKMFDVIKTRNLKGLNQNNYYDIIIYEPPLNQSLFANAIENSKKFYNILNENGNILVKVKDFKTNISGYTELKGSYDLKTIFESNNFYLFNQIIYKIKSYNYNDNEILHMYFMIFKKKKI